MGVAWGVFVLRCGNGVSYRPVNCLAKTFFFDILAADAYGFSEANKY
jgi:hypothetical protein